MASRTAINVVGDAVFVRILAGQKARAAWRTEWRRDESIFKTNSLTRDALNVWDFDKWIINFVPAQVVNQDENNIRASRGLGGNRSLRPNRKEQRKDKNKKMPDFHLLIYERRCSAVRSRPS